MKMFKKTFYSVGLDVGTSNIKLIKLKFSKDSWQVENFFSCPVEGNLLQALKRAAEFQEIKYVNTSVSGSSTIIRYVSFPKMAEEELRKSLKFEVQKYIPFSVSEVNLDISILKQNLPDNKMLVAVAAVKKDFINQRIKLLEANGFRLNIVDIDSLALSNAFNFNFGKNNVSKQKTVALLDVGATFSNLSILEEGMPLLSRDLNIAGNSFSQKVSDALGLDLKAAETLKIAPDNERMAKIAQAMEGILSSLATEIRVSFDYYESQSASSVSKIYLSGGGSLFPGLKDVLANNLGIEVEFWDPLKEIEVPVNIDSAKIKAQSAQFAVAIGLALRG